MQIHNEFEKWKLRLQYRLKERSGDLPLMEYPKYSKNEYTMDEMVKKVSDNDPFIHYAVGTGDVVMRSPEWYLINIYHYMKICGMRTRTHRDIVNHLTSGVRLIGGKLLAGDYGTMSRGRHEYDRQIEYAMREGKNAGLFSLSSQSKWILNKPATSPLEQKKTVKRLTMDQRNAVEKEIKDLMSHGVNTLNFMIRQRGRKFAEILELEVDNNMKEHKHLASLLSGVLTQMKTRGLIYNQGKSWYSSEEFETKV